MLVGGRALRLPVPRRLQEPDKRPRFGVDQVVRPEKQAGGAARVPDRRESPDAGRPRGGAGAPGGPRSATRHRIPDRSLAVAVRHGGALRLASALLKGTGAGG
ncbi:MAG: hypothetical protein JWR08_1307 [Enterovirga sp.]|nr:hypothetical protein [Enterovirga sp.]